VGDEERGCWRDGKRGGVREAPRARAKSSAPERETGILMDEWRSDKRKKTWKGLHRLNRKRENPYPNQGRRLRQEQKKKRSKEERQPRTLPSLGWKNEEILSLFSSGENCFPPGFQGKKERRLKSSEGF